MKLTSQIKRILSAVLVLVMIVSCLPVSVLAAETTSPIIVIAGSDFQNSSGHSKTASLTSGILSQILTDYSYADGFLFAGDYDYNYNDSANGKAKLQETVLSAYPELSTDAMVWVQGNHDSDSLVGSTLSSSGAHDAEGYGVYVINEKDYMWYNDDEATIRNTAAKLKTYLNTKRNEQYTSPIFVVSHLPLHYSMRTLKGGGDGKHANYIFDVLNEAGEAGLNIIFLFGHDHSHGWDDYLGGASIYLEKGDKINIGQNSTTVYAEETLAFTYMNAGYVGYYGDTGNGSDQTLTMTTFAISGSDVTIRRYDANGYHTLKASGVYGGEYPDNKYASPVYSADTSTVGTPHTMALSTEVTPAGEDTEEPGTEVEGRTYTRITSASELEDGGSYLLFYSGSYFMLPEVVAKTNGSSYRKGFDLESTSVCGSDTITGDYQDKEWTLTSSGSGWLLGNGTQYAKLTSTSDMSITATFESSGDVFTVGGSENAFTFSTGSYVLNYNSRGLINGYASNAASFWIYQMTNEGSEDAGNEDNAPTASVRQIMSYSELQENVGYLIVADEGEDITLTNQTNGSGLLLSGSVDADNEHLWYLDLTNEYIRYGSPTGSDNYLKVTNGGASVGSSSNRVTEILDNGDGTFSLYRSSYYMNRYGGSTSTKAAGYNQNNNGSKWKIYEVVHAHNYESVTVDATCAQDGSIVYTCDCGDTYTEVIAALGHSYEAVVTAPTCTEEGYTTYTCACGDSYVADQVAVLDHEYASVTVEPTCTEEGSVVYTCDCGDTYTEVIAALGHSYEAVVTAPTCTGEGYTTYTCACGDSYVADQVDALGHAYESVTVEPTCTEEGSVVYTCDCGDTYTEAIAALGHSYEAVVTAPTCTGEGYTTYTCACGDSYVADQVDALGHAYESVTVEPTCTEGGYTGNTCTVCGDITVTNETAALGHAYETTTVAPTCETAGYTTYTCHCGDSYIANEVAALGHDYASVVTEATCVTDGYTTHTCAVCDDVTVDTVVDSLGHDWETVTVDATCTAEGSVTTTCARCGETEVDVIPALGHSYETSVVEPTCTEDGCTTYTCGICADSYTEVIEALGHDYASVVTAPTCTEDGYTTYTCACGDTYVADQVAALGHDYAAVVTAPTCTEDGYTTYTCACGDTYVADTVAALGHDYTAVVTAPTCTEDGYTTYTCACGDTYVADQVAALGHDYTSVVTAPTCTKDGYTTYTCACGDTYVADQVAALGHSYTGVEQDGYMVYTCDRCSDSWSEKISNTYTKVTSISSGNEYVITLVSGNTYYALSHANNSISVVKVSVSNGVITSDITSDLVWTYSGSKLSYVDNGTTYYLYESGANNWWSSWWGTSLTISSSKSSTISWSNNKLKIGTNYLRYSNGSVSLSRSSTTTNFFVEG